MWITAAREGILQEVSVKGFEKFCIYIEMGETDDILRNESEEDGNVTSVRKMKAPPVKMETETLIGKDRQNLTCLHTN
jgi:hypothetical protein